MAHLPDCKLTQRDRSSHRALISYLHLSSLSILPFRVVLQAVILHQLPGPPLVFFTNHRVNREYLETRWRMTATKSGTSSEHLFRLRQRCFYLAGYRPVGEAVKFGHKILFFIFSILLYFSQSPCSKWFFKPIKSKSDSPQKGQITFSLLSVVIKLYTPFCIYQQTHRKEKGHDTFSTAQKLRQALSVSFFTFYFFFSLVIFLL